MNSAIQRLLEQMDLSPVEASIYLSNLALGAATASAISKHAGVHRVTTYETLKRLAAKGFVKTVVRERKAAHFEPTDIEEIRRKMEQRKEELESALAGIEQLQPLFAKLSENQESKPSIHYFEGKEGIKTVLLDTLKIDGVEILSFTTGDSLSAGFGQEYMDNYWKLRAKRKIPARGIMAKTDYAVQTFTPERNAKEMRRVKFVPKEQYPFKDQMNIYGNTISLINFDPGNEYGILVHSPRLAQSLSSLFELLWSTLR